MRLAHQIITGIILALGLLHISFTWFNFGEFNLNAMWFFGSGVAIILAGLLNLVLLRVGSRDTVVFRVCQLANLFFAALFGLALTRLFQPQVIVGFLLFIGATMAGFTARRKV